MSQGVTPHTDSSVMTFAKRLLGISVQMDDRYWLARRNGSAGRSTV